MGTVIFKSKTSVTTVCFRDQEEALVCLKALVAELQNQRSSLNSASRTSLLICNQQEQGDGAPSWSAWEENKGIHKAIPRIAVLVQSSDLIELRKKVAFYLQCISLIGKLFDEFGGDLH